MTSNQLQTTYWINLNQFWDDFTENNIQLVVRPQN